MRWNMKSLFGKKICGRIVVAVLLAAFASLFVSCDSSKKFLKDYESFVVAVEKAAEKGATNKLEGFEPKIEKFKARAKELEKNGAWTKDDEVAYAKLSGRLTFAMSKLSVNKTADNVKNALKGIGDKLGK